MHYLCVYLWVHQLAILKHKGFHCSDLKHWHATVEWSETCRCIAFYNCWSHGNDYLWKGI